MGILMLPVPLLRNLHFESAIVAALIGAVTAAYVSAGERRDSDSGFRKALRTAGSVYLIAVPLLIRAVITGCLSLHGVGFWLLTPIPAVFLGFAIGNVIRALDVPLKRTLSTGIVLLVAVGEFMVEFFSFPQVYYFNHIWGMWPGPVYDEAVRITVSFIYFRILTVLWICLLWGISRFNHQRKFKWWVVAAFLGLALGYANLEEMGIISPRSGIKQKLTNQSHTRHFAIYADPEAFSDDLLNFYALRHEFYYQQIADTLKLDEGKPESKIESFLYAHPWQKKQITGAKYTSYVPVWLDQDQLHVAKPQLRESLKHELVHILAKSFGNRMLNASWSIGLVEGLAVALSPRSATHSTVQQIVAANPPYPTSGEMRSALSITGFYKGRKNVNYITMGSFVQFLLKTYNVQYFKDAYRSSSIREAYPVSFDTLVNQWHKALRGVPVDTVDRYIARNIFSQKSILEKPCPHTITKRYELWDFYLFYMAEEDTARALPHLQKACDLDCSDPRIWAAWAGHQIRRGEAGRVINRSYAGDSPITVQLRRADALLYADSLSKAMKIVHEIKSRGEVGNQPLSEEWLSVRSDTVRWRDYLKLAYTDFMPDTSSFNGMYRVNQLRAIVKAIEHRKWRRIKEYAENMDVHHVVRNRFSIYTRFGAYLAFKRHFALTDRLLDKLSSLHLRLQYREELKQLREWIAFLKEKHYHAWNGYD